MRRWLSALLLLGTVTAGTAEAQSLATDKTVYEFGDTIAVTYVNPGKETLTLALQRPHQVLEDRTAYPYDFQVRAEDSGTWSVSASAFLYESDRVDREHDPSRVWLRAALLASRAGKYVVVDQQWILLQRRSVAAPGALSLPGHDSFVLGETIEIGLSGVDALRPANLIDPARDAALIYAELWKAGRVVPGGAHLPDVKGYATYLVPPGATSLSIAPENEPLVDELGYWGVGHYELRLHGTAGALLDSVVFTVGLAPASAVSLRLDPAPPDGLGGAYDHQQGGPNVYLDLAFGLRDAFRDWWDSMVSLCRVDEAGVTSCLTHSDGLFLVQPVLDGAAASDAAYVSGGLRPGAYAFVLSEAYQIDSYGARRHARLTAIPFEIGGDYPPQWLPTRPEPRLDYGQATLALSPQTATLRQEMQATGTLPEGMAPAERKLSAKVYPAEGFGFGCHPLLEGMESYPVQDDLYEIGELFPDVVGRFAFAAPEEPGRYELRLTEQDSLGEPVTVARAFFTVELHVPSDALRLESSAVVGWGQSLTLSWQLPPDLPFDHPWPHVYRAAEVLPGGALRAAQEIYFGSLPTVVNHDVAGRRGTAEIGPFAIPGPYEVQLWSGFDGRWRLARVLFDVLPPEGAPLPPPDTAFARAPQLDDWPSPDDPRRGLAVWTPEAVDCVEPSFPEPPALRLVEKLTGDPADDSDDRYREVAVPFPGHPYHLEAAFATAPPEAEYRVRLNDRLRVFVMRTADPRLYRSEQLVIWEAATP